MVSVLCREGDRRFWEKRFGIRLRSGNCSKECVRYGKTRKGRIVLIYHNNGRPPAAPRTRSTSRVDSESRDRQRPYVAGSTRAILPKTGHHTGEAAQQLGEAFGGSGRDVGLACRQLCDVVAGSSLKSVQKRPGSCTLQCLLYWPNGTSNILFKRAEEIHHPLFAASTTYECPRSTAEPLKHWKARRAVLPSSATHPHT